MLHRFFSYDARTGRGVGFFPTLQGIAVETSGMLLGVSPAFLTRIDAGTGDRAMHC